MSDASAQPLALTSKSPATKRRWAIALYGIVTWLYWVALYLYAPTLPTYVESKSENLALVGVVLSMYGLWQAIVRLPLGIAADWVGWRKPFIVVGLFLTGLGAWTMGVADGVNGLILGRAITGLSAGTWVLLVVAFSSLFPPQQAVRATSILTLVGSVARVIATSITGSLNELGGYSLPFFLAAGFAMVALFVVVPAEEKRRPRKRPSLGGVGHLITRRDVLLPSVLSAVIQYANWATSLAFVPILARRFGATGVTQSLLVGMGMAVVTLGNFFATILARRLGARRLTSISFVGICGGIIIAAIAPSLTVVFIAQFCISLAVAIGYPVLMGMSIQDVEDAQRTTAMGLHQAVYAIGMFAGPWLSGILADLLGLQPMLAVTAVLVLVAGLLGARGLTKQRSTQTS